MSDLTPEPDPTVDAPGGSSTRDTVPGLGAVPGDTIGPFKIIRILGEGGFGVVYLAEQTSPVKRSVALKIIKPGMDTRSVIARFEAERQALAMMDHPGIARVFEAGATPEGRPYFVMEFVKGEPINQYCDRHTLDTRARLALFVKVCDAIQHAHQKGVIHRDLKPGNILVTIDARDDPQPKVIDFGIAKATAQSLTEKTLFTEQGQLIGTPEYMSPEQAEMSAVDVDTRSDVYSLGVILYELLSGRLPFDPKTLRKAGFAEIQRIIREEDPPRPSTKLTMMSGDEGARIAEARKTKLAELQSTLRRELEWIPLKALRKERTERYGSVEDLGEDVRRYLAGEPLEAGPESASYRLKKLIRRNKGLFVGVALITLALVGGIIGTTIFAVRAAEQARIADLAAKSEVAQRTIAEQKTSEAQASEKRAQASSTEATLQRDAALRQAYFGNIHAAEAAVSNGSMAIAMRRLMAAREAKGSVPEDQLPFEWRHLHARSNDALDVLRGHDDPVCAVVVSPDGKFIISGSSDNTLRLWDMATGEEVRAMTGHARWVKAVACSPDGTRLASGSMDRTVRIWDAATGESLHTLSGHKAPVEAIAFSPDGKLLASGSRDATVRIWDVATGESLGRLEGHMGPIDSLAFHPNGAELATASRDRTIRLWDPGTREELRTLDGHENWVTSVAYNHDGSRMASSGRDQTIRLWDRLTGEQLGIMRGPEKVVECVVFSPDGTRIASGSGNTIHLWDAAAGIELGTLRGHEGPILSLGFSPDGSRLVSGSIDQTLRLWDTEGAEDIHALSGHDGPVYTVAFSPDGRYLASGGADNVVRLWDVTTGESLISLRGHENLVFSVMFSPDGRRLVSSSRDRTLRLWDTMTGEQVAMMRGHRGEIYAVAFSPDGTRLASGSGDKTVRLWNAATGEEVGVLQGGNANVTAVAFSPDGTLLASGGTDKLVRLWDVATGEVLRTLRGHQGRIRSISFTPDGQGLATGSLDTKVKLWDIESGEELTTLEGHSMSVYAIAMNPDGSRLASGGGDNTIRIWDVATGEDLATLHGHDAEVNALAFNADGTSLASGGFDAVARLWDTRSRGRIIRDRTLARERATQLAPIVEVWIEKADGDNDIVLAMLELEKKNRSPEEIATLRNLVLKQLVEYRQAQVEIPEDDTPTDAEKATPADPSIS